MRERKNAHTTFYCFICTPHWLVSVCCCVWRWQFSNRQWIKRWVGVFVSVCVCVCPIECYARLCGCVVFIIFRRFIIEPLLFTHTHTHRTTFIGDFLTLCRTLCVQYSSWMSTFTFNNIGNYDSYKRTANAHRHTDTNKHSFIIYCVWIVRAHIHTCPKTF